MSVQNVYKPRRTWYNADMKNEKRNSNSAENVPVPVGSADVTDNAESGSASVPATFGGIEQRGFADQPETLGRTPEYERIIDDDGAVRGGGYASVKGKVISNNRLVWMIVAVMSALCIAVGICSSLLTGYFMRRGSTPPVINTEGLQQNIAAVISARKNNIAEISCAVGSGASNGSGIIIERKRSRYYILTNEHIIDATDSCAVRFSGDDAYYAAEIVGYSKFFDIAVLSVEYNDIIFDDLDGTEVFSPTTEYGEGDYAVAIGNGMAMGIAAYDGIISRSSELLVYETKTVPVMRTTAAINDGMSGGALFDMQGRMIGLNTYRMTDKEDTGFVTPVSMVYPVYKQIVEYGDGGDVGLFGLDYRKTNTSAVGWIGCSAAGFECEYRGGKLTVVGSTLSGLKVGDVITHIGGVAVTSDICRTSGEFLRYRRDHSASGVELNLAVSRSGAELTVTVAGYHRYV